MSIDPPAKIIVIGAGPIGLETALYARYLGYDVTVLEAGEVCRNLVDGWGHVRMFTPFSMNSSPLGLAALQAQDPAYQPPAPDAILTGREWAEQYLIPLSQSDLLADHVHPFCQVMSIVRDRMLKTDLPGDASRGGDTFWLDYLDDEAMAAEGSLGIESGLKRIEAKVVIDCSGTFPNHNGFMPGGMSFRESYGNAKVNYFLPDVFEQQRDDYANRHTLVIGGRYSAATTVVNLADLAGEATETKVTWLTRASRSEQGPVARIANDRLPQRDQLAQRANALALADDSLVDWIGSAKVVEISDTEDDRLLVRYRQMLPGQGESAESDEEEEDIVEFAEHELTVDQVVANVGYRPSLSLYRELQLHLCYATEGPMKLAASLLAPSANATDCLDQPCGGAETLITTEPNFYVLGAKSYGRNSNFLFASGLDQIREIFTVIGGRATLNLYESVKGLL